MSSPATRLARAPDVLPAWDETFLRKLERLAVVAKRVARRGGRGERRARRAGAGIEFADHREYAPGDDLRHLDWNLYGRHDRPLVRLFDEDEDLPVYILVDASASMGLGAPPKLALAREAAAALAYVGLAQLDRVALYLLADGLGQGLGLVRGKAQIHALLRRLGQAQAAGRTDLRKAVTALIERHPRRGLVILLSDFYDPQGYGEALDRLRYSRFEPVAVHISGADEAAPPAQGELMLVDAETLEERLVVVTPATAETYRARFRAHAAAIARFCRERAIPCVQVSSDHSFESLVLHVFRVGGILR